MNGPRRVRLTEIQAASVQRARADLHTIRTDDDPDRYPEYVGILRGRLDDMLRLISELTGGAS